MVNSHYEELVDASRYQQSTYKSLDRLVEYTLVAKSTGAYTNCYWLTEDGRGFVRSLEALFAERHKRALRRLANENNRLGALARQLLENEGDG